MNRPTKIIIDGRLEFTDIKALQITFDTNRETLKPYEMITIYDSNGGIQTYPLHRTELVY